MLSKSFIKSFSFLLLGGTLVSSSNHLTPLNIPNSTWQYNKSINQKATEKLSANNIDVTAKDRERIEAILKRNINLRTTATSEELILAMARQFLGVPYVAYTLERNKTEKLIVNLSEMDCTTYLEYVVALCLCINAGQTSFDDYAEQLRRIRYRDGKVDYVDRLHYFHWWVEDNQKKGIVKEVDWQNIPFVKPQVLKINYMSENSHAYIMMSGKSDIIKKIKHLEDKSNGDVVKYFPKEKLKDVKTLSKVIKNGDLIGLVTNKKNLDTTHLGFALWKKGQLYLINASSLKKNGKRVVEPTETLYDYLMQRSYNTGIRVARLQLPQIKNR